MFTLENTEGFTKKQIEHLNAALEILMTGHEGDEQLEKEYSARLTNCWMDCASEDVGDKNWDWEYRNSVEALVERCREDTTY